MKEIEIYLRKLLLSLYLFFRKNEKKNTELIISSKDKILLIRLNRIGDALVTTHLIKNIKEHTGCEIHVLADRKNHFIFENDANVDRTLVFPKKLKEIKILQEEINNSEYHALFDLHDDVSTSASFFIGLLNVKNKVGYNKKSKKLFTHLVPYLDPTKHHIMERYLQFLNFLNIPFDQNKIKVNYQPTTEALQYADELINNLFEEKKFLVGINISAGSEARFWGIERYKKLISYFSQYDINIILFSSPSEIEKAKQIIENEKLISAEPTFEKMTAVLKQIDFLFSPDTSLVHIASSYNLPVFGIYINYNTDHVVWYPYNTEHELIITEKPNFNELEFDTVINKLKIFFECIYYDKRNS